jgi:hypothetical protein
MRIWTIHPKYLDPQGLVALWREALLAQKVLRGLTQGYRFHPQLERFRAQREPVVSIAGYLHGVHDEAARRGYQFDAGRIAGPRSRTWQQETEGQLLIEWDHLLRKLRARSPVRYREFASIRRPDAHSLFRIVPGEVRHWEKALVGRPGSARSR